MKELVQRLQAALEKEKASVGDLKQQVRRCELGCEECWV